MISFEASQQDRAIISKIAARAVTEFGDQGVDLLQFEMDVLATHANGCQLDLERLLDADTFTFRHDIAGIYRHLERDDESPYAGQLRNCFLPRTAKTKKDH